MGGGGNLQAIFWIRCGGMGKLTSYILDRVRGEGKGKIIRVRVVQQLLSLTYNLHFR